MSVDKRLNQASEVNWGHKMDAYVAPTKYVFLIIWDDIQQTWYLCVCVCFRSRGRGRTGRTAEVWSVVRISCPTSCPEELRTRPSSRLDTVSNRELWWECTHSSWCVHDYIPAPQRKNPLEFNEPWPSHKLRHFNLHYFWLKSSRSSLFLWKTPNAFLRQPCPTNWVKLTNTLVSLCLLLFLRWRTGRGGTSCWMKTPSATINLTWWENLSLSCLS